MLRPPTRSTLFPYTTLFRSERVGRLVRAAPLRGTAPPRLDRQPRDRKSTRLNSSHEWISYAVFCLKKKKQLDSLWAELSPKSRGQAYAMERVCGGGSSIVSR